MEDEVLNIYMNNLLKSDIQDNAFELYISLFSKFLGYTNFDYKYNGTYLIQYIKDFKTTREWLERKKTMYDDIVQKLLKLGKPFEIVFDDTYLYKYKQDDSSENAFVGFNKHRLTSNSIEIKVTFMFNTERFLFYKNYDCSENDFNAAIIRDIRGFIRKKKLRNRK